MLGRAPQLLGMLGRAPQLLGYSLPCSWFCRTPSLFGPILPCSWSCSALLFSSWGLFCRAP
eukprot:7464897-Pyramimonas_sp.AAC.1